MIKYLNILFLLSSYFYSLPVNLHSQTPHVRFDHISIEQGLSQSTVHNILKDSRGFLWFGTMDGLNKYDGYKFTVYRHDPDNPNSLSSNVIWALHEDQDGVLWIGTTSGGGLNKFDPDTERFVHYQHDPENPNSLSDDKVWAIYEDPADSGKVIWVGTLGGGLNKLIMNGKSGFDRDVENIICYKHDPKDSNSLSNDEVWTIYKDSLGNLWIGTSGGGLNKLTYNEINDKNPKFIHYKYTPGQRNSLSSNSIRSICEDKNYGLFIGTEGGGLNLFNIKTEQFVHYKHDPLNPYSLSSDDIWCVYKDHTGVIWVATNYGLNRLIMPLDGSHDSSGKLKSKNMEFKFVRYYHNPNNPASLSDNSVYSVYDDQAGVIWFGTVLGGINKWARGKYKFVHYQTREQDLITPGNNFIRAIYKDQTGLIWVGVENGGCYYFDRNLDTYKHYTYDPDDPYSICTNQISCFFEDRYGNFWIGSFNGLMLYDRKEDEFYHQKWDTDNPDRLSGLAILVIFEDRLGNLWIGTTTGLNKLVTDLRKIKITKEADLNELKFKRFVPQPENPSSLNGWLVNAINEDELGYLWVGTSNGGLNRFDPQNETFVHYQRENDTNSLSDNNVTSICIDQKNTIWVGTYGSGLNKLIPETADKNYYDEVKFKHYTENDGLANNVVYGLLEDNMGCLWISTNKGLSCFDPKTEYFQNYDVNDGLQSNEFNRGVAYKSRDGELLFGGVNGFNAFYPDQIKKNLNVPPIQLTDFKLFNESVSLNNPIFIEKLAMIKEIRLEHDQNFFSLEFSALDYTDPIKNQYAYMLEGIDKTFIYSGTRHYANYTKIPPGKYTFRVKGSNNDGVWNDQGTSVRIIITPPWWRTHFAYVCYILIFLVILLGLRQFELRRSRLRNELKMHRFEAQKLHEIDSMKSRFFANISHEFRTPLTLILGPINKILTKTKNQEVRQELNMMQRNARRLQRLINQLLDLSKIEAGKMTLQARPQNIVTLLNRIVQSFESQARLKGIDLKFQSEQDEIIAYIDQDKIENIFYNLLSNALKFTPGGGSVAVSVNIPLNPYPVGHRPSKGDFQIPPFEAEGAPSFWRRGPGGMSGVIQISVADTGIGIPQNRLEKIFDRFYQVDDSYTREHEGSGIGLALTKELVDLHHGKIEVESEVNKGTTFTVYLPLGKGHLKPEEIAAQLSESSALSESLKFTPEDERSKSLELSERLAPPSRRKTIPIVLIVEDNRDMRSYLKDCLANDYRIIEAVDGEDGLQTAIDKIPDLIISDVMMPKMDGFQLCQRLKTDERTSHIPVILLTARAAVADKIGGLEFGADDYIIKPFDTKELLVRVKNLIQQRRLLRKKFSQQTAFVPDEIATTPTDVSFLQKAKDLIEGHIADEDFSVELLAKNIGMSRSQLHRKLRALTDHSTSEFIRTLRLQRAAYLLQQQRFSVTEVAFEVGFNNPSYFAACFRKQFGKLPSEYKIKEL